MRIAIIPARGGSKRIPRKNIKLFAGKPMIAYPIIAALESRLFDHVIVSTDDTGIMELASRLGAEVPFARPAHLADDHTPTVPVIAHAITMCEAAGWKIELACCIYPCVPLIDASDLRAALTLLEASGCDYSFPVCEYPSPIQRALRRDPHGRTSAWFPEHQLTRTQDLEPAYYDAGQFYWGSRDAWLSNPKIHSSGVGLPIPGWRTVDIDTPDDWFRAEAMLLALEHKRHAGTASPPAGTAFSCVPLQKEIQ